MLTLLFKIKTIFFFVFYFSNSEGSIAPSVIFTNQWGYLACKERIDKLLSINHNGGFKKINITPSIHVIPEKDKKEEKYIIKNFCFQARTKNGEKCLKITKNSRKEKITNNTEYEKKNLLQDIFLKTYDDFFLKTSILSKEDIISSFLEYSTNKKVQNYISNFDDLEKDYKSFIKKNIKQKKYFSYVLQSSIFFNILKENHKKHTNSTTIDYIKNEISYNMEKCFSSIFKKNIDLGIVLQINNNVTWRINIDFDPKKEYDGVSYKELFLDQIFNSAKKSFLKHGSRKSNIDFSLTGEMGITLFNNPSSYSEIIAEYKKEPEIQEEIKKKQITFGLSFNSNNIDGGLYRNREYPFKNKFNKLINEIDFLGISAYQKISGSPFPVDFSYNIITFLEELWERGIFFKEKSSIKIHFSEFGVGGAFKIDTRTLGSVFFSSKNSWLSNRNNWAGIIGLGEKNISIEKDDNPWKDKKGKKNIFNFYKAMKFYIQDSKNINKKSFKKISKNYKKNSPKFYFYDNLASHTIEVPNAYSWNSDSWDWMGIFKEENDERKKHDIGNYTTTQGFQKKISFNRYYVPCISKIILENTQGKGFLNEKLDYDTFCN